MKMNRLWSVVLTAALILSCFPLGARAEEPVVTTDTIDFSSASDAEKLELYHSSTGGFVVENGFLTPSGNAGEFKAMYPALDAPIHSVSVELHPVGANGPIYGGLYIGASDAKDGQDQVNAIYIGVESNFTGWSDALNRLDLVIGQFPAWKEHKRQVSETGLNNNLFTGGMKQPVILQVDIVGNQVNAKVSLASNPGKFITASFTADRDLSLGQVGIRSHHNNARYDNFKVTYEGEPPQPEIPPQVTQTVTFEPEDIDQFDFYHSSNGGFAVQDGKLVPTGEAGQFKAIYKDENASFRSVAVDIYPGQSGINGGIYLDVTNADHPEDAITGLGILLQSDFTGWADAINRIDLIIGTFPQWTELNRVISETGAGNALYAGSRQPVRLQVEIRGNRLSVKLSLLDNLAKSVSYTYEYAAGVDIALGNVGIRSHISDAAYDNFTVAYDLVEQDKEPDAPPTPPVPDVEPAGMIDFESADSLAQFDIYRSSTGTLTTLDGKLVPTGETGEFKAIYRDGGSTIQGVSVDLYPGQSGQINSGVYIGASTVRNGVDMIKGLVVMVESNHSGWDDAVNRIDLVVGRFPLWKELHRYTSETGAGNALFAGSKEPVRLYVELDGDRVNITLSLISDPTKFITTSYEYTGATDLSAHNVGLRSAFNDGMFDDFTVYSQPGGGSPNPEDKPQEPSGSTGSSQPGGNTTPDTGDTFRPEFACMAMLLCAAMVFVLVLTKRTRSA